MAMWKRIAIFNGEGYIMGYQIMAIVILVLFYGCYFIKMGHQYKKGIETNQMGKGKAGVAKWIEITLKIVTCLVPLAEVISIFLQTGQPAIFPRILGACIGSLGVAVFISSVWTMADNWRAGVPGTDRTELVTRGIYQISRNPAFLGFDLVYIGMVLMFFNWVLFGISCFAVLMLHMQIINVEEEFLLEAFGEEYLCYREKVCRYLGRKRHGKSTGRYHMRRLIGIKK